MKKWLGIDIGGTFIKYGIVNENYQIEKRWKIPTLEITHKDEFFDYICANMEDCKEVNGIGVCSPGLIDSDYVIQTFIVPKLDPIRGSNIAKEIASRTGNRVTVINDAKAAGLCELKLGNAKGTQSSAFFIIGTGIGGCICNSEDVVYGVDGFAGEFHFIPYITDEKKQQAWKRGRVSSVQGLVNNYNSRVMEQQQVKYGHEVTALYLSGDESAGKIVDEWLFKIAVHLMSVTVSLNPEVICIGGGISEEEWFLKALSKKYHALCMDIFQGIDFLHTRIIPCKYRNDSNLLGAILKFEIEEKKERAD
ncbi:Sugar kinase of the NBD/HSP70 family, may contain an N-terminal HTH domain [Anaerocolumna jejuensis DSM 15929]|uniref:Sugar kinase of the NBD/HSP70 family, may contain an N-terminal HTH domain n=1 Tax=Anaerocolumna jejuensis DSM 15929 TaxID=1121322 RepID=A0A1M6Z756_9FIRM|nr:ROK family protein [Anaerocolumna jejuensis]SHL26273.1 Sugar kinase of the NBD/HSP70 family, may contain an N-terminal HTH domain [Anaerocolumna jejuensis DSM 15929]